MTHEVTLKENPYGQEDRCEFWVVITRKTLARTGLGCLSETGRCSAASRADCMASWNMTFSSLGRVNRLTEWLDPLWEGKPPGLWRQGPQCGAEAMPMGAKRAGLACVHPDQREHLGSTARKEGMRVPLPRARCLRNNSIPAFLSCVVLINGASLLV